MEIIAEIWLKFYSNAATEAKILNTNWILHTFIQSKTNIERFKIIHFHKFFHSIYSTNLLI